MRRDGCSGIAETDVTDPNGNVRKVTFNSDGYILSDTGASGKQEQQTLTYIRDGSDRILSVTDALNRTISFTHDGVGNITSVTYLSGTPNAVTTTLAYTQNSFGQPVSVTRPAGPCEHAWLRLAGQPAELHRPAGEFSDIRLRQLR